jgi:hypothetical protein
MDLATCTIFFRWFPAFMVNVGKWVFLTWVVRFPNMRSWRTICFFDTP